ncbi:hypothetical protein SAMN02745146_0696 [Hymenobacter daecheongensis DSM 21074]|uniref:4-amino-4-deoxy-L-arabinose transferase n=1 Tax=Hymenobacter daecheongensis DSM 21074 TaxID=1121955 RepID=A0A1M6AMG9_9BACT|nr:hypothetical protein [Hymenobacter daecheongensis]SHI37714.1 hypothetical protein SAMN02745146_0696 [Hymenobacter daecheongensis DSM 21074]
MPYKLPWPLLNRLAFGLAVLLRWAHELAMPALTRDMQTQTESAVNLLRGHGVSLARANWQDLSVPIFEPLNLWPPGYAWLMAALLRWVSPEFLVATQATHWAGLLGLLLAWWYLLKPLRRDLVPYAPALIFLFWGLSNAPFHLLFGTDLLALACYTGGLAVLFGLLTRPAGRRRKWPGFGGALLMSGLGFGACLLRFAYYPLALALPLALLLFGWRWRPRLVRPALAALLLLAGLIGGLLLYQARVAGDAYYLTKFYTQLRTEPASAAVLGLYWHHLLQFDPILYHSFFSNELDFSRLTHGAWLRAGAVLTVSALVALLLGLGLRREWRAAHRRGRWWPTRRVVFHLLAGGAALLCAGLLAAMSVRYPAALVGWFAGGRWTYVADTRYFLPVFLSISAMLLVLTLARPPRLPRPLVRGAALGLLGASLLLSLLTRDRRTAQQLGQRPAFFIDQAPGVAADVRRLDHFLRTVRPGQPLLLGRNYYNKRVEIAARLAGHIILDADSLLAQQPLRTSRPVLMLFDLNPDTPPTPAVAAFLQQHQARQRLWLPALRADILSLEIRP